MGGCGDRCDRWIPSTEVLLLAKTSSKDILTFSKWDQLEHFSYFPREKNKML